MPTTPPTSGAVRGLTALVLGLFLFVAGAQGISAYRQYQTEQDVNELFRQQLINQRKATIHTCRDLNELRRQLYVAGIEISIPLNIAERFLPSQDCEVIP